MRLTCKPARGNFPSHSGSAVCTPSRYALLTGRYHWRTRLQNGIVDLWGAPLIAPDRLTLGDLVREHGHQSDMVGKGSGGWCEGSDHHPAQLYNLADDIGESRNLYAEKPGIVAELTVLMERLVAEGRSTPGPKQKNDVDVRGHLYPR